MCSTDTLKGWLNGAMVLMGLSLAILVAAFFANGSIVAAVSSPGWMIAAGVFLVAAAVAVGMALSELDSVCQCADGRCEQDCSNARNALRGLLAVLSIEASACFGAAIPSAIPVAGAGIISVIGGALIMQIVALFAALKFVSDLSTCANRITINVPGNANVAPLTPPDIEVHTPSK